MSTSVYRTLLESAFTAVSALPAFTPVDAGGEGRRYRVVIHKEPAWSKNLHALPGLIVAPRADLADRPSEDHFDDKSIRLFDVYIGLALHADETQETLWERLARREEIRLTLFKPEVLRGSYSGQFGVEYDPAPSVRKSWPEGVEMHWQLFSFLAEVVQPWG